MSDFTFLEGVSPFLQELLFRSLKGAVLVSCIFLVRRILKNRIAPTWRYALWFSVPLILFWPVFPASQFSLENFTGEAETLPIESISRHIRFFETPHPAFFEQESTVNHASSPESLSENENDNTEAAETGQIAGHETAAGKSVSEDTSPVAAVEFRAETSSRPEQNESRTNFAVFVCFAIWAASALTLLLCTGFRALAFHRLLHAATVVSRDEVLEILRSCQQRIDVTQKITLYESAAISSPVLSGVLRPKIILPQGLADTLEPKRLRHVFFHELAHVKRKDIPGLWVTTVTLLTHWFNPMLWIAARKMNEDREEACDALALKFLSQTEKADYGETLVLLSSQLADARTVRIVRIVPGVIGIAEPSSLLSRRIETMISRKKITLYSKVLFVGLLLLILAALFTKAARLDKGEKLFGVIPVPKMETPNNASVTFTTLSQNYRLGPQRGLENIVVKGKILGLGSEPIEKLSIDYKRNSRSSIGFYGARVEPDGSFSLKMTKNEQCSLLLKDGDQRFAAPMEMISTFDFHGDSKEITIQAYPARFIEGVVVDKDSGKPFPGISMTLTAFSAPFDQDRGGNNNTFNREVYTDEQGKFHFPVSSGSYYVAINSVPQNGGTEEERAIFTRTVSLEEPTGEPVTFRFEFPRLFTGKLLNPDASPAAGQFISFEGYRGNPDQFSTKTDAQGTFHLHKAPRFLEMMINSPAMSSDDKKPRLHRWIGEEFSSGPTMSGVFQLQQPATFRARFLDPKTGAPFPNVNISSFQYNKPGDGKTGRNMSYGFQRETTDEPGVFVYSGASPGVEYHFQGSFPGINRSDVFTATATESGEYLDFGDVTLDDSPWKPPTQSQHRMALRVLDANGRDAKNFDFNDLTISSGSSSRSQSTSALNSRLSSPTTLGPTYEQGDFVKVYAVRDPQNRWAAEPLVFSSAEEWEAATERTIHGKEGRWIRGTVFEETTGKPLAKVPLTLVQKYRTADENPRDCEFYWEIQTDANGRFEMKMLPGEYGIGVNNTWDIFGKNTFETKNKALWTRDFTLKKEKATELELRIPEPFVGKVLTAAGKPAVDARVEVQWTQYPQYTLRTDSAGEFRLFQAPTTYSLLKFVLRGENGPTEQRLLYWVEPGENATSGQPTVFRLSDIQAVGTLVDAGSGEPVMAQFVFVSAEHASESVIYPYEGYFAMEGTNEKGEFRIIGLTPGVRYVFRFGGQQSEQCAIVIPAERGNTIQLGSVEIHTKP